MADFLMLSLTRSSQVIADLYERYVELIGTTINDEGDTMSDGYVSRLRKEHGRMIHHYMVH